MITFLENVTKFDFSGVRFLIESTISGTTRAWDYTYNVTTLKTFREFLIYVNFELKNIDDEHVPVFEIEKEQDIMIYDDWTSAAYLKTPNLTAFSVEIFTDNLIVEKAFSLSLKLDKTVTPAKYSSNSDIVGIGAFRLPYFLQLNAYCNADNVTGGMEPSEPIEEQAVGEDYISFAGNESSDYRVISGLEFPYRYHINLSYWLQDFFDFSRNSDLEFANDTYSIGGGKTWRLLVHSGANMSTVYAYLDIVRKGIRLVKKEEFTEL